MARKSSIKHDKKNVRNSDRNRTRDRRYEPELNAEPYSDYDDEYEAVYEVYNDDFGPDYDLREYEREIEREKERERARNREHDRSRGRSADKNSRKKQDSKKTGKAPAKADKKSAGKNAKKPAGKNPRSDKNRPRSKPIAPGRDEDMLSEFSDDTNTFYTDEHKDRKRRENESKQKKQKAEKQRKPMSPARRKLLHIFSYAAIITVVIAVGIVLSLTVLFKTQVFAITGNTRYTEQEITEASGINIGQNIFLAPKNAAEKNIKEKFPYVEDVSVGLSIPDTIKIDITEAIEGYLIKLSDTDYLVISSKGRILERVTDRKAYNLPIFIGPTPVTGEPGDYVSYEDDKVVEMIDSVTRTFADNGYTGITEIDATNMGDISFTYDNRIKVKLGIPEELDYKIRTAMTIIIEKLDSNQTGTTQGILDVSRCNSTRRSYFNEQQIAATTVPSSTQPSTQPSDSGGEDYTDDGGSGEDYSDGDYSDDNSDNGYSDNDWTYDEGNWSDEYSDNGGDRNE